MVQNSLDLQWSVVSHQQEVVQKMDYPVICESRSSNLDFSPDRGLDSFEVGVEIVGWLHRLSHRPAALRRPYILSAT